MDSKMSRKDFLRLMGAGGVVLATAGLNGMVFAQGKKTAGFYMVQMSDTHWGFNNPAINPDFSGTLKKAVAAVNMLHPQPDFIVFTGDLTHTTDDDKERRSRMTEFRGIIKDLKVKDVKFLPGEHDAALDNGDAFKELFGKTHYSFDHKGVHFIALDNVSDPHAMIGDTQLQWLREDLRKQDKSARIVVLTHRPLFDLAPDWDWATADGAKALDMLTPYKNVNVLYGHIHQLNHHVSGHISLDSAMGLMYPLPAPHSVPKKAPLPWDPAHPYRGLGYRQERAGSKAYSLTDVPLAGDPDPAETIIKVTAKRFEYSPNVITLKKGVPAVLELTSLDRKHGFNCPGLHVRADINPGKVTQVHINPDKAGRFDFHCDLFCGSGHETMTGTIIVTD